MIAAGPEYRAKIPASTITKHGSGNRVAVDWDESDGTKVLERKMRTADVCFAGLSSRPLRNDADSCSSGLSLLSIRMNARELHHRATRFARSCMWRRRLAGVFADREGSENRRRDAGATKSCVQYRVAGLCSTDSDCGGRISLRTYALASCDASAHFPCALTISSITSRTAPSPPERVVTKWAARFTSGAALATATARPTRCKHGKIREIVADVSDFVCACPGGLQNFFQRSEFRGAVLIHKLDFAFPGALRDGARFPAGNEPGAKSRGARELQSRPVIRAESLDLAGRSIAAREQPDAAVGQHAIHVHEQHPNFFRPRDQRCFEPVCFFAIGIDLLTIFKWSA